MRLTVFAYSMVQEGPNKLRMVVKFYIYLDFCEFMSDYIYFTVCHQLDTFEEYKNHSQYEFVSHFYVLRDNILILNIGS